MSYHGSSNSVRKPYENEVDTMTNRSAFSQLPMIKAQSGGGTAIPNNRRHLLSQGGRKTMRTDKLRNSMPNTDRLNNIKIKKNNNSVSDNNVSVLS